MQFQLKGKGDLVTKWVIILWHSDCWGWMEHLIDFNIILSYFTTDSTVSKNSIWVAFGFTYINCISLEMLATQPVCFNFALSWQPRRSRGMLPFISSTSSSMAFRPDVIFVLLRKAYKDPDLGTICRKVMHLSSLLCFAGWFSAFSL